MEDDDRVTKYYRVRVREVPYPGWTLEVAYVGTDRDEAILAYARLCGGGHGNPAREILVEELEDPGDCPIDDLEWSRFDD